MPRLINKGEPLRDGRRVATALGANIPQRPTDDRLVIGVGWVGWAVGGRG